MQAQSLELAAAVVFERRVHAESEELAISEAARAVPRTAAQPWSKKPQARRGE